MWMCMPSSNPLAHELRNKAYRAFGIGPNGKPLAGLEQKEQRARLAYLRRLMSETIPSKEVDERMLMPGFGFHEGYERNSQRSTLLNKEKLTRVAEKIVRGVEYIQKGAKRYVEDPYKLEIYFPHNPYDDACTALRKICPTFHDGTNTIQRGAVSDRPLEPVYIIRIWEQWEIWGVILHKDNDPAIYESAILV